MRGFLALTVIDGHGAWARTVLTAVLAVVLSGCLAPSAANPPTGPEGASGPQDALHAIADLLPFEVTAPDGVALRGTVFLPDGEGPFPTVLELSPYWETAVPTEGMVVEKDGLLTMRSIYGNFTRAGLAVALVNIRGTGDSGGCFEFMQPQDGADAAAVIEAIASQPWSNGRVGLYGWSYSAWPVQVLGDGAPSALSAAIVISGVTDLWSVDTRNGASLGYPGHTVLTAGAGAGAFAFTTVNPERDPSLPGTSPSHICPGTAEGIAADGESATRGDKTPWYAARDNRPRIAASRVPTWVVNGLAPGEGHILQVNGLWEILPEGRRLLLGQWGHGPPLAERPDFPALAVPWFQHLLAEGPGPTPTALVEYQDDGGSWHVADQWPPPGSATTLHLTGSSLVLDADKVLPSQQQFQSIDLDPGPGQCGPHQAIYVSPPVAEDVLLAGNVLVNLTATSTLPNGNVAVYVYRTPGPGSCPDAQAREIRRALTDLRHADGSPIGRDFPIGAPSAINILGHPFSARIHKGERIVVAVGGSSEELAPHPQKPLVTIHTGPDINARVTLPVVEGTLRFSA